MPNKTKLRKQYLAQRQQLSLEKKQTYSEQILQQLSTYLDMQKPDAVLIYYALSDEVDTRSFFHTAHIQAYAPRMVGDLEMQWLSIDANTSWQQSAWGVFEPENGQPWQSSKQKVVLICPLVSFDRLGNRLGMGKGCFDRWLDQYGQEMSEIIGLAFACQESAVTIPSEAHDQPLHTIITEQEIITCRTF